MHHLSIAHSPPTSRQCWNTFWPPKHAYIWRMIKRKQPWRCPSITKTKPIYEDLPISIYVTCKNILTATLGVSSNKSNIAPNTQLSEPRKRANGFHQACFPKMSEKVARQRSKTRKCLLAFECRIIKLKRQQAWFQPKSYCDESPLSNLLQPRLVVCRDTAAKAGARHLSATSKLAPNTNSCCCSALTQTREKHTSMFPTSNPIWLCRLCGRRAGSGGTEAAKPLILPGQREPCWRRGAEGASSWWHATEAHADWLAKIHHGEVRPRPPLQLVKSAK